MARSLFRNYSENTKLRERHTQELIDGDYRNFENHAGSSPLAKILSRPVQKHSIGRLELVDLYKGLHHFIQQISSHLNQRDLENILIQLSRLRLGGVTQPSKLVEKQTEAD